MTNTLISDKTLAVKDQVLTADNNQSEKDHTSNFNSDAEASESKYIYQRQIDNLIVKFLHYLSIKCGNRICTDLFYIRLSSSKNSCYHCGQS